MTSADVPKHHLEALIDSKLGRPVAEYYERVRGNDWEGLQELWRDLYSEGAELDPVALYGLDYSLHRQESLFSLGARTYAGSFVEKLSELYTKADPENRRRIRRTWPLLWIKYVGMGLHKKQEQEQ